MDNREQNPDLSFTKMIKESYFNIAFENSGSIAIPRPALISPGDSLGSSVQKDKPSKLMQFFANHIQTKCKMLASILKLLFFTTGVVMSVYQTFNLMKGYVHQPIVARSIPRRKTMLERPQLIVCINVFKAFLENGYRFFDQAEIQTIGLVGKDMNSLAFSSSIDQHLLYNSAQFPFVELEKNLYKIAMNFRKCHQVLGRCNELHGGWPMHAAHGCCNTTTSWTPTESICYKVNSSNPQKNVGKPNAAAYELLFPRAAQELGVEYDIYLSYPGQWISTRQQPMVSVGHGMEVNVKITMVCKSRLNKTSKCTDIKHLVDPRCSELQMIHAAKLHCKCDELPPVWFFNISELSSDGSISIEDGSGRSTMIRPCRLFETWRCLLKKFGTISNMNDALENKCIEYQCNVKQFFGNPVVTQLPSYFDQFSGKSKNSTSVVYVFYGSMTINQEFESKTHTWQTLLSDLGGIWGLWLGWSLFYIASLLLGVMVNMFQNTVFTSDKK